MAGNLKLTGIVEKKARRMLKNICRILDENDIPYVVENGTLLGIIRENRLLPWDNDVDISITEQYLDKLISIRWKFWLCGYRTRIRRSIVELPHLPVGTVRLMKLQSHRFLIKRLRLFDIFVKYQVDDKHYWAHGIKKPVLLSAPSHFYKNTVRYEFDGYNYLIPGDYDDYLTHRYGDWRKTVKKFDFKSDDQAIIFKHKDNNKDKKLR